MLIIPAIIEHGMSILRDIAMAASSSNTERAGMCAEMETMDTATLSMHSDTRSARTGMLSM